MPNIITSAELLTWVAPEAQGQAGISTDLLDDTLIPAAETQVEQLASVTIRNNAAYALVVDGSGPDIGGRYKDILSIDKGLMNLTAVASITENGESLTSSTSRDLTKDVLIDLPGHRLIRQNQPDKILKSVVPPRGWAEGTMNITATLNLGHQAADAPLALKLLLMEWTWLLYKRPTKLGLTSKSKKSVSQSFTDQLSASSQAYLESLMHWG